MSYVDKILDPDETVVYRGEISLWSFADRLAAFGLLAGAGFALPALWAIAVLIAGDVVVRYLTTEVAITTRRVVAKVGFVRRQSIELLLPRVESVQVEQNLLGRLFDFGSIVVAGAGNPSAPIPGIRDPLGFRRAVLGLQGRGPGDGLAPAAS